MDCHRCGRSGTLTRYTLDGRRAVVCRACGFVGIPADHGDTAPSGNESWTEALDRFAAEETVGAAVTVSEAPPVVERGDPPQTLGDVGGVSVAAGLDADRNEADQRVDTRRDRGEPDAEAVDPRSDDGSEEADASGNEDADATDDPEDADATDDPGDDRADDG